MREFQQGKIEILVATTVIEVGVDVPNATVMVIEHADRFGLAQLHQLRGRIGRGAAKSYCVLMRGGKVSEEGERRLDAMVRSNDGFQIAELDLELRGPANFSGRSRREFRDFAWQTSSRPSTAGSRQTRGCVGDLRAECRNIERRN